MKVTPEIMSEILALKNVGDAVRLLRSYANENPELEAVIRRVTYGIDHSFHYKRYELGMYVAKEKSGYVIIDEKELTLEALWDEIDNRIALAINELVSLLQDDSPFRAAGEDNE